MNLDALKALIRSHEGIRARAYKDTKGLLTVGIGFNLAATGAQQVVASVLPNVDYASLLNGQVILTAFQIDTLFDYSLGVAIKATQEAVPSFDVHPETVQLALVDIMYNLGPGTFAKFVRFRAAIEREDYNGAVAELTNSAWYHEVGKRAQDDIALIKMAIPERSFVAGVA